MFRFLLALAGKTGCRRRFALLLLLPLATGSSSGAAPDAVARLKERPLHEIYHDEAPVSGRVVVGITVEGTGQRDLALLPPPSAAGQSTCVRVLSRDGRYASKNTFLIPSRATSSTVSLEYPSEHIEFLSQLGSDALAVLASPGDCTDADTSEFYLSKTHSGPVPTREGVPITVLVNSARADTFIAVRNGPKAGQPTPCVEIEEGRRTGFDTSCVIELSEIQPVPEILEVRILRRQYERMLPPIEFKLALPRAP